MKVFAATRAPTGLAGWRKDSMSPGSWALLSKADGTFGPEVIVSCPKCFGDIILNASQSFGKTMVSHSFRQIFDPRKGQGMKTITCGAQFKFLKEKNCFEISA
jgi:hypothetical protein